VAAIFVFLELNNGLRNTKYNDVRSLAYFQIISPTQACSYRIALYNGFQYEIHYERLVRNAYSG